MQSVASKFCLWRCCALIRQALALCSDLAIPCFHLILASRSAEYSFEYVVSANGGGGIESTSSESEDAADVCGIQLYATVKDGVYKS